MTQDTQTLSPEGFYLAIGEVISLLAQSDLHNDRSIAQIGQLILPAINLGQVRIWRGTHGPVGFASWAFLDEATERAVLTEDYTLQDHEWNCGTRPVVLDFVAPYGNGFRMARDLSRTVFPNRALTTARRDANGTVQRVVQFPGLDETGTHVSARAYAA